MSSVNYNLNNKCVRLLNFQDACVRRKNGNLKLNNKHFFLAK